MSDAWRLQDHPAPLTGDAAVLLINGRMNRGEMETWLKSDAGRSLAVITNGSRALVMLLDEPDDAGEHAIDPTAVGEMGGYVLENGQHDTYKNTDTVELGIALVAVQHIVDHGRPPKELAWQVDR